MSRLIRIFKRISAFVYRYRKYPLFIPVYGIVYFMKGFSLHARFYTDEELLSELAKGKSIVRLGDGDIINIQFDMDNCYHRSDKRLRHMYKEIIETYNTKSPYILSVPIFMNTTNAELKALGPRKLEWGIPMKIMFMLQFNRSMPYMDAHNFYYDNYLEQTIAPLFKDKQLIVITNRRVIDKQKNNPRLPWNNIIYIEAPEINAMDAYESIKQQLDEIFSGKDKKKFVMFVAMGPVGKYIVYEYAHRGYQGIDIGKGVETMFTSESIQYLI